MVQWCYVDDDPLTHAGPLYLFGNILHARPARKEEGAKEASHLAEE